MKRRLSCFAKAEAASLINKSDLSPRQKAKYLSLVEFGSSTEVLALINHFSELLVSSDMMYLI